MTQELLFRNTGRPAFISITGLTMDFVDTEDYLVAYSEETKKCYGSYKVLNPNGYNFLVAMGNDNYEDGKTGFNHLEEIKLGYWDAQLGDFFELDYNVSDWQGNPTEMKFMQMGMFKVEVTDVKDMLTLHADDELSKVEIDIQGRQEVELEKYFFKVTDKNVKNLIVAASGTGELKKVKFWIKEEQMYANYQYTPLEGEEEVTFTALGQSVFDDQLATASRIVKFDGGIEEPQEENVLDDNDYFKLVVRPFRSFGNYVFIQNKANDKLGLRLTFVKDGKSMGNVQVLKKGEEGRCLKADDYDAVKIGWIKVGVRGYHNINKTYEL